METNFAVFNFSCYLLMDCCSIIRLLSGILSIFLTFFMFTSSFCITSEGKLRQSFNNSLSIEIILTIAFSDFHWQLFAQPTLRSCRLSGAILQCSWFFLQFKEFEFYWSAVFTTRRGVLENSFFSINFSGVIFETGNETREKIWIDFGAEQK